VLALAAVVAVLAWQSSARSVDFPIYHRVGAQILDGDFGLYPDEVYSGGAIPPHGFRYLPAVGFAFVPLALLPLPAAAFVFFVFKLAAFVYLLRVAGGYAGIATDDWRTLLIAVAVVAGYAAEEMRYGNVHLFVVALMVYAFDRADRGGVIAPGVALALAIATKLTPVGLLAYFAIRRRFALCLATAVALAALAVAPVAVVGGRVNAHLLTGFARYAVQKVGESDNYGLRGVLDRVVGDGSVAPDPQTIAAGSDTVDRIWMASVALLALLTLALVWRPPPDDLTRLLELSLVFVVMLIASPHTQRRYFVQLLVPVVALLGVARLPDEKMRLAARIGLAATAIAGTLLPIVFIGRYLALIYQQAAPYFVATVVLLAVLAYVIARLKQRAAAVRPALAPPPVPRRAW
jgi:hypothetical protein